MPDPNFLLIGAQKCGTTWLAEMLRQHPDVYTPERKELHFFDLRENYARGWEWYRGHFDGWSGEKAIGESTPNYLWVSERAPELPDGQHLELAAHPEVCPDLPRRVHQRLPSARLIAILRDPVHRAVSSFHHHMRMRRIAPHERIAQAGLRHGILGMGFYHCHLSAWLELYDRTQLLLLVYEEDVQRNQAATLRRVFEFLDVAPDFEPANTQTRFNERSSNAYMMLRYYAPRAAHHLFRWIPGLHRLPAPMLDVREDEKRALAELYAADTRKLEALLGRSLPWRSGSGTASETRNT